MVLQSLRHHHHRRKDRFPYISRLSHSLSIYDLASGIWTVHKTIVFSPVWRRPGCSSDHQ